MAEQIAQRNALHGTPVWRAITQGPRDERAASREQQQCHQPQQQLVRNAPEQPRRETDPGKRRGQDCDRGEQHLPLQQQAGEGEGHDAHADAEHRGERECRTELLFGKGPVGKIDGVRRSARAEQGAGDASGESGEIRPASAGDRAPRPAPQAVAGIEQHEHAERQHRARARQIDQCGYADDGTREHERHHARELAPDRVARMLQTEAQGIGEIHQSKHRQRKRQGHEMNRERNGHQRRAEAGDAIDKGAEEGDRCEREQRR